MATSAEVGIIGAGPIGLELAVGLKRAGVNCVQFDAKQIGYTISWFAPQTKFFSSNERIAIAGVPLNTADQSKATREEYLAYLRGVVQQFGLAVRTYEPIVAIENAGDGFVLTSKLASGIEQRSRVKKLILATGGTDRPRRMNIPGEDLPHVSAYFQDPHLYFGKRLLVIGGKNSAVEAALRCHLAGADVALSYRGTECPAKSIKYWLLPEINHLIKQGRVKAHFCTTPVKITPTHVTLAGKDGAYDVSADFVLSLVGYEQDTTLFKLAGIALWGDCSAPKFDPTTMETNVPGIYVAGTAVGGTQNKFSVFIENCHVHVDRIVAAMTGQKTESSELVYASPES